MKLEYQFCIFWMIDEDNSTNHSSPLPILICLIFFKSRKVNLIMYEFTVHLIFSRVYDERLMLLLANIYTQMMTCLTQKQSCWS